MMTFILLFKSQGGGADPLPPPPPGHAPDECITGITDCLFSIIVYINIINSGCRSKTVLY